MESVKGNGTMDNVYLVTQGEYSDYHVVAAFSTHEKAAKVAAAINGEVEEEPLDPDLAPRIVTKVVMRRNGEVICAGTYMKDDPFSPQYPQIEPEYAKYPRSLAASPWTKTMHLAMDKNNIPGILIYVVNTDDKQRAIKRTNEVRTQLIAQFLFPEDGYIVYGMPWGYAMKLLNATIRAIWEERR